MPLDLEASLKEFYASAPQRAHPIMTLEFDHSSWLAPLYLSREPYEISITTDAGVKVAEPANFKVKLAGSDAFLDQVFEITLDLTDVTDRFRELMKLIPVNTDERPSCVYRAYMSDDLTTVVEGPASLQVEPITYRRGLAALTASSPRWNLTRTGELYIPRDVPMLRNFL